MRLLEQMGCCTHTVDLRITALPFCNGDSRELWPAYPGVAEMRAAVSRAHVVVLSTPEYHGGISGVLKNALDLLSEEHLKGKVAGVISVLGGPANTNALNDLSRIMRSCHAWVMPHYVAIGQAHTAFHEGAIEDTALLNRFEEFTNNLVESASRICDFEEAETVKGKKDEDHNSHSRVRSRARKRIGSQRAIRNIANLGHERTLLPGFAAGETANSEVRG